MRLRDQLNTLRDQICRAAAENGARDVRLVGSVARGEDDDRSDVDLLVSLDPGRTLLDLARLETRLELLVGRRVEVLPESALRESVRTATLRDAIPL